MIQNRVSYSPTRLELRLQMVSKRLRPAVDVGMARVPFLRTARGSFSTGALPAMMFL